MSDGISGADYAMNALGDLVMARVTLSHHHQPATDQYKVCPPSGLQTKPPHWLLTLQSAAVRRIF